MTITIRLEIGARERLLIALVLSVLVHLATLWKLPPIELSRSLELGEKSGPLVVQLIPPRTATPARPPSPPPGARPQPRSEPRPQVAPRPAPPPAPKRQPARPTPPPVIARNEPGPGVPVPQPRAPAPATPPAPPAPPAQPATDFGSLVQSRQLARGEAPPAPSSPPGAPSEPVAVTKGEDENARANRIAAANLGLGRRPTFGPTAKGGGVFQITRIGYDSAEFLFYGWNRDIRRDTTQTIDVRKGSESDIRIAIIRRMIAIIRDHEQGDFIWESQRLNRNVTLSARPRDQSGLEEFLWREFFEDPRRPAQRP